MNLAATRYQAVEVIVNSASAGRFNFTDQPNLRTDNEQTVVIDAIEIFSNRALTTSPLSNTAIAPTAMFLLGTLVLNVDGYETLQNIPLHSLNRVYADTGATFVPYVTDLFRLNELTRVDWTKSYVQMSGAPAGTPFSFYFGVYYRKLSPAARR
jgi:hypothetical protein